MATPKVNVTVGDLVTFYGVTRFDIKVGQEFTINGVDFPAGKVEWPATNDQVLDIVEGENQIEVTAKTVGTSRIFILGKDDKPVLPPIEVNVLAQIAPMATSLGLNAEVQEQP